MRLTRSTILNPLSPVQQGLYCAVSSELPSDNSGEDQRQSQQLFLRPNITQGVTPAVQS